MQGVPKFIVERQLGHFEKVHPDYAAGVRAALAAQPWPRSPSSSTRKYRYIGPGRRIPLHCTWMFRKRFAQGDSWRPVPSPDQARQGAEHDVPHRPRGTEAPCGRPETRDDKAGTFGAKRIEVGTPSALNDPFHL